MGAAIRMRAGFYFAALAACMVAASFDASAIETLSCGPASEPVVDDEGRTFAFCAKWNPEFNATGNLCCHDPFVKAKRSRRRKLRACAPHRIKAHYCDEVTPEQKKYRALAEKGELGDLLDYLRGQMGLSGRQDQCGPNNGFLAFGRPIVATASNRVQIRSPERCTNFGTDAMAAMIEWLGRQVSERYADPEYAGVRLTVGDVSAPKGGCLSGRGGRRGHSSHTNGQDLDLGFLVVEKGRPSPVKLSHRFDRQVNWWFLRQVLTNPIACVKRVFLDRKLIGAISREAGDDPVWKRSASFVQHQKGHKNHFHVRLGDRPGAAGCLGEPEQGVEIDEEVDLVSDPASVDLEAVDAEGLEGPEAGPPADSPGGASLDASD